MGVPIYASRQFVSGIRIPVPEKLNQVVGRDSPSGSKRIVFWNRHKSTDLGVVTDEPLFSDPEFEYITQCEYLASRKDTGDWDIRPTDEVQNSVCSKFHSDDYVFFMLNEDWIGESPSGFYVLTTADLIRFLPCLREFKDELAHLQDSVIGYDRKRPQEGGRGTDIQMQSLVKIIERAGLTDLDELVNQVFTSGRIETDLDLPKPG